MLFDPSSKVEERKRVEKKKKGRQWSEKHETEKKFFNVNLGTSWHTVLVKYNSKYIMNCSINLR